ncbi:hypothetical protein ID866_8794 [Astraeus odoratus]|nr:hypothetical protein ID866_8794 [Astraeus odoratus]
MGNTYSFVKEIYFPPAPTITVEDIPDMTGKVVLITGANTGIGKETARVLLTKNAKVWIACRNTAKGDEALQELKDRTGRDAHLLKLNLANLQSIKQSVEEFSSKETQLHVLCNNAGLMNPPVNLLTDDGYDLQFGTHVVGHFYLTKLLLPILLSTAKSSSKPVRVINVSSGGHWLSKLNFDTFKDSHKRRAMFTFQLYCQSKHGNIAFSTELHRRYHDQGIVSISLHPGLSRSRQRLVTQGRMIKSDLGRHHWSFLQSMFNMVTYDVSLGALTQLYASTFPECESMGGKYLIAWARPATPRPETQDPDVGKELWTWLEEQVAGL